MANLLLTFIILSIFLLIIAETVYVRFTYNDEAVISIDFLLFILILYPSRKKKAKRKKSIGVISKFEQLITTSMAIKRSLNYLLKHSTLTVHRIEIPLSVDDPAKIAVQSQNLSSLVTVLLTYLSIKTAAITTRDDIFISGNNTLTKKTTLDFTLKSSLHTVIFSYLIYLRKKRKIRKAG